MGHTRLAALAAATLVLGAVAAPASADDVTNRVNNGGGVTVSQAGGTYDADYVLQSENGDGNNGCNATTTNPVTVAINVPSGVTASPASVVLTGCGQQNLKTIRFTVNAAGPHRVTHGAPTGGVGTTTNENLDFTINTTAPVVQNTAPVVTVTGVAAGSYEIGSEPTPACSVVDAQQPDATATPVVTGTLVHGLGTLTATCSFTDAGGLSDSDSVTYTIVDTGDPTITASISPAQPDGDAGWYVTAPTVSFECDDDGSGIAEPDGCTGPSTLGEGADQSVTGTATDWAGNTSEATVDDVDVDLTDPAVVVSGGPTDGASYFFGEVPAAPTCEADDATSGPAGCTVTGGGTSVGAKSYTLTATDNAGRTSTETISYTVKALLSKGYFQPVDMNGVVNTVKAGSTVPLKFEVFGSTELTSVAAAVSSFTINKVTCSTTALSDEVETVTSGATVLRYDTTGGQFIQNWQTPKQPGACYAATTYLADGVGTIRAFFKLK